MAAAAGFAASEASSPGCMEMRVVFGVQPEAPRQVSRTKTWRRPLLGVEDFAAGVALDVAVEAEGALLLVTATKAMKRPLELNDGRIASVPVRAPEESTETSAVEALHPLAALTQVSRR